MIQKVNLILGGEKKILPLFQIINYFIKDIFLKLLVILQFQCNINKKKL